MGIFNMLFGKKDRKCQNCGKILPENSQSFNYDGNLICQNCHSSFANRNKQKKEPFKNTQNEVDFKGLESYLRRMDKDIKNNETRLQFEYEQKTIDQKNIYNGENSLGLKRALILCKDLISKINANNSFLFASAADKEVFYLIEIGKYIAKINAWTLYFRIGGNQQIAIKIHSKFGICQIDYLQDKSSMSEISLDIINYDNIEIEDTLLRNNAGISRNDFPWTLSLCRVNGAMRPLYFTPFNLGSTRLVWVDAETGDMLRQTGDEVFAVLETKVDKVCQFSYDGEKSLISKSTSVGFVNASELMKFFPTNIQKIIMESIENINNDIKKNYSL